MNSRLLKQIAVLYLLLVIFPSSLLFIYSNRTLTDNTQSETQNALSFEMQRKSIEIDAILDDGLECMHSVVSSPEFSSVLMQINVEMHSGNTHFAHYYSRYELHPLMQKILDGSDVIENVLILIDGQCAYAYKGYVPNDLLLQDDESYKKLNDSVDTRCLLGNVHNPFGAVEGEYLLYAQRLYGSNASKEQGMMVLLIPQARIEEALLTYERYDDSLIALYDEHGELLGCNTDDANMLVFLESVWEDYREQGVTNALYDATEKRNLKASLVTSELLGTSFIHLMESYHFEQTLSSVTQVGWIWMISAVLLLLLFLILTSHLVLNPIQRLSKAIEQVGSNDLSVRVQYPYKNELTVVFEGFNSMIESIVAYIDGLKNKEREKQRYQIAMLKYQINPHFLYNTLNCVRFSAIKHNDETTARMLVTLSRLLRHTLSNPGTLITLGQELSNLQDYVALQQLNYEESLNMTISCDEELKALSVPSILLQPIVENAISHGLGNALNSGMDAQLRIEVERLGDALWLSGWDNGIGMSAEMVKRLTERKPGEQITDSSHIGLRNIQNRIQLLYGTDYGLKVESEEGKYTRISILLPCMTTRSSREV